MEYKVEGRKCPECGSRNTRRSHMWGLWEGVVLRAIGVRAYRCESCDRRYYEFQRSNAEPKKSDEKENQGKR